MNSLPIYYWKKEKSPLKIVLELELKINVLSLVVAVRISRVSITNLFGSASLGDWFLGDRRTGFATNEVLF